MLKGVACAKFALVLAVAAYSGCREPYEELFKRQDLVGRADRAVMAFVCPESQRVPLEAEDPLRATIDFVERGTQLENWAAELTYPATPPPRSFVAPLDSFRIAISVMAKSFAPAFERAGPIQRGCYRMDEEPCSNKLAYARIILSRINGITLNYARDSYFRHRAKLAELFAKADAPLEGLKTCAED